MSLKSVYLTAGGTWRAPVGVSSVWINQSGGGGGGEYQLGLQGSRNGGGAGEFFVGCPVAVTPNTIYSISVGASGTAGLAATSTAAGDGGTTSFNGIRALGGIGGSGLRANGGYGGGPAGATTTPGFNGNAGTRESPTAFGGASGGNGGGSAGFTGGQVIGEYPGGAVGASPTAGGAAGGSGGGSTMWSSGATGGDCYAAVGDGPAASPGRNGTLGSGGGGAAQDAGGVANPSDGGAGGAGLVEIFYIAP